MNRASGDLLNLLPSSEPAVESLGPGAVLLRDFARGVAPDLITALDGILAAAPWRHMVTPGGHAMSVSMTNCGAFGWFSDRKGYRYVPADPLTGASWPAMPEAYRALAVRAAAESGYPGFVPDSCLINRYEPGARMGLHQDHDETDMTAPIVSISLGLPATFLFGGATRKDRPRRMRLVSGDIVVWGGASRLFFHGVDPVPEGEHKLTGRARINLTFRKAR